MEGSADVILYKRGLLTLAAGLLSGCAGQQSVLSPASDQARTLSWLGLLMGVICLLIYLLVVVLLGLALRRRARPAISPTGEVSGPVEGWLQRGLTIWASFVAAVLVVLAGASFVTDRILATPRGPAPLDVRVTGQQWWWRIAYRSPITGEWIETANELHLPLDRPARIELTSADVIHSFWVPGLHGKLDMIPGRANVLAVTPRKLGWLRGQCAEFCGLEHALMAFDVKVETPAEFQAWLAHQAAPAQARAGPGLALIENGACGGCHTVRGTRAKGRAGPDLTHLASRRALAAKTLSLSHGGLMGWITQPQALKPGAEMPASGLDPERTKALVAYLEALK